MLIWFLRQSGANKLAVLLAAAVVMPILWTALASYMLIALLGAGTRQLHPLSDPATYFQWWMFWSDAGQTARTHLWIWVSGVAAATPFVAFVLRQVLDYLGSDNRPSLYGKTQWADRRQMKEARISTTKRPV